MVVDDDGELMQGYPQFAPTEPWYVAYAGYTGEPVYHLDDEFGEDLLGYSLPPSHLLSAFHQSDVCAYCGARSEDVECDHIVPYAKGGSHLAREFSSVDNAAIACQPCNNRKRDHLGWTTLDGRTGFYWDGTPGNVETPPPLPKRARKRK